MIAIIHSSWDSDIVLDKGDLQSILEGKVLSGEIADYKTLGQVYLSKWENDYSGFYFNLEWNKNQPNKYHFKINLSGIEALKLNNYAHGRYDNGLNGSKLSVYGHKKDEFIKENIEFAIEMIKLDKK
jgi:hypothetical protein